MDYDDRDPAEDAEESEEYWPEPSQCDECGYVDYWCELCGYHGHDCPEDGNEEAG